MPGITGPAWLRSPFGGDATVSPWTLNLFALLCVATYFGSFLSFDRLLQLEARSFPDHWDRDGRPIGIYTWARSTGRRARPIYDGIVMLVAFLRLYFVWLFRTPEWVRSAPAARWRLRASRSLFWLFVVETLLFKELM